METLQRLSESYDKIWQKRDVRMDGWPLLNSPWPTLFICITYVYVVKVAGPWFMKNRKPMELRGVLIVYNTLQVIFSSAIFIELLRSGWWGDYSYTCQPVDYSNSPKALKMALIAYLYYISKFTEFLDTIWFVLRKKYSHISLLHVVHHGIMPISVWPGARFVPGGHATFFGLCNTFIHIFMYLYYLLAGLGPKFQKFCWWKQHMTTMQMIQFVLIMIHGFQLFFNKECEFPYQFSYYIGAHAILFFFLFLDFYIRTYTKKATQKTSIRNGSMKKTE